MADSVLLIKQDALAFVGCKDITNEQDPTREARMCNQFYPPTKNALLSRYPWNFAMVSAKSGQVAGCEADEKIAGRTHKFVLPADCLSFLGTSAVNYVVEGNTVFLWAGTAFEYQYIKAIEDVTKFHFLFREALVYALSLKLGMWATQDKEMYVMLKDRLQTAVTEALNINAINSSFFQPPLANKHYPKSLSEVESNSDYMMR